MRFSQKIAFLLALLAGNFTQTFAQIDLELTGTLSNANPAIFTNVDYTLTLKNNGSAAAADIVVSAPDNAGLTQSFGLVFTSATPSVGSWNIVFETWTVPTLAAGASATLKLTLFTMKAGLPNFFAEVVAATGSGDDSTPASNFTDIPEEDDEVLISPNAPPACDLDIQFVDVECQEFGGNEYITFKVLVSTADPNVEFVKLGTDQTFTNSFIIEPNKPFGPPFAGFFQFWSQNPVKFYAAPLQNLACVKSKDMPTLVGCGDDPPPSACVLPYWGPSQIFCLNGGSNYGLVIDLRSYLFFTDPDDLKPNDVYQVFANDVLIGAGVAEQPTYLGLDNSLPLTGDPVTFRIVRTNDNQCLGEIAGLQLENYCLPPDFINCNQASVFPWHEWIKRVEIDGLDKTSGKSTISNFQTGAARPNEQAAFVNAGEQMPFKITIGFSWVTYNEGVRIWIDSNRDGVMTDLEAVYEGLLPPPPAGPNTQTVLEGFLNIPADAVEGLTTMKISLKRNGVPTNCESIPYGEVELYSVNIIGGQPAPNDCGSLSLTILGTECNDSGSPDQPSDDRYYIDFQVNWLGHEGEPVQAVAYRGSNPGQEPGSFPPFVSGFNSSGFVGTPARYGPVSIADYPLLNFYAYNSANFPYCESQVVAVPAPATCSDDAPPPPVPNCEAFSNFPWEDWIGRVRFPVQGFDSQTGKSPYSIFNDPLQLQILRGTNQISLTIAYSYFTYDEYWRVWIDYDHDGSFETTDLAVEAVSTRPQNGVPNKTTNATFQVPASAIEGATMMRVMMRRGAFGAPCGEIPFGEVEDYAVTIAPTTNLLQGGNRSMAKTAPTAAVFPNPAGDFVNLNFSENRAALPVSVRFFNQLGLETGNFQFSGAADFEKIDLSGFSNGQYFLKIQFGDLRPSVEKVVIARMY